MKKPSSYKIQKSLSTQLGFGAKILIVLLLLGFTFKVQIKAQTNDSYRYLAQSKIQRGFDVDFQWFKATEDSTLLAVLLSIPHHQLAFERQDESNYIAHYQLNLEIYKGFYEDENTRELAERIFIGDTIFVSQYESTLDPNEITKVLTTLYLPREKYTIHMDYNHLKGSPSVTGVQIDSEKLERLNPNRRRTKDNKSKSSIFKKYIPKDILREIGLQLHPPKLQLPLSFFNYTSGSTEANITFSTQKENKVVRWVGSTNQISFSENSYVGIPTFALDSIPNFNLIVSTVSKPENVVSSKTIETMALPRFRVSLPLKNQLIKSSQNIHSEFYLIDLETKVLDNKRYKLKLLSNNENIHSLNFETFWQDMPTSLFQLDVAIEMLRYIVHEQTIEDVLKKKNEDKMIWFRSFWDSKDPIQATAKNELMNEYYSRIDFAFDQFSTASQPEGYDSDQGQIYIKIGPPKEIIRSFPASSRVIEEWIYPNRTFVFTASSGFGDFILVNANKENNY